MIERGKKSETKKGKREGKSDGSRRKRSLIPVRFTNGQRQVAEQKDVAEREKLEGEANDINYSQSLGLKYPKNSRICSWTEAPLVGPDTKCLCLNKGFYPSPARALCSDRSTESSTLFLPRFFFSSFFFVFSLSPFVRDASVLLFSRYFKFYLAYSCTRDKDRQRCQSIVAIIFRSLSTTYSANPSPSVLR